MSSKTNKLAVVVLSIFVFFGSATGAETEAEESNASQSIASPLVEYRKKALSTRFSIWSGLKLQQAGKELELGFFGGGYKSIFEGSPAALESMETYRHLRISGTVLYVVGFTTLIYTIVARDSFIEEHPDGNHIKPALWAVLISGGAVGLTGAFMMQGANSYLADAIHQYNDDLFERLSSRVSGISPRFRLAYSFSF